MKSFNLATDGTDENRIPQYPTVHDYEYLISPDFHQLSFPKTNNPDAYYSSSMSEPNWRPTSIECSLTSMPSSVFPPLDYGTPSLSCSVSPVQENETPSSFFGQVSSQCPSSSVSSIGVANRQVVLMRKNRRELMDRTGKVCTLLILDVYCS